MPGVIARVPVRGWTGVCMLLGGLFSCLIPAGVPLPTACAVSCRHSQSDRQPLSGGGLVPLLDAAGVALPEADNAQDVCLQEAASGLRQIFSICSAPSALFGASRKPCSVPARQLPCAWQDGIRNNPPASAHTAATWDSSLRQASPT